MSARREHHLGALPAAGDDTESPLSQPIAENDGYDNFLDISTLTDPIERIWLTPSVADIDLPGLFWDKIPRNLPDDACWPWRGSVSVEGYAIYGEAKRYGTRYAHLQLWRHMHGDVPDGHEVDHSCFNRVCMNPAHHRLLTVAENRKHHDPARLTTHCAKGHPMSGGNLYVNPKTKRRCCRECMRVATRRWRERQAS